jgi:hypothetical protein
MPERMRTIELLYKKVTGTSVNWWYGDGPVDPLDQSTHDELVAAMDDLYLSIVDRIDWNRLTRIAMGRCAHKQHGHVAPAYGQPESVCGESMRDAMCYIESGAYDYVADKDHYKRPEGLDWPKAVAKVARKRKLFGR